MGASDPDDPELNLKKKLILLEQSYLNPSFSFMLSDRMEIDSAMTGTAMSAEHVR